MNISASIDKFFSAAGAVYKRFPLVLVFSSVVFYFIVSGIYEWEDGISGHKKAALVWGIIMALPLYFNFTLIKEWALPKWIWWISLILLIILPVRSAYFFWFEVKDETEVYIQLATFIFVHGIVASLAYFKFGTEKSFWQLNSLFLLNFINSSFYTAVITLGILAGFGLVNILFGEFYYRGFGVTFAFIATFFHPLLFLAWLPNYDSWSERVTAFDLPKFFRTLIVYILIPLSIGYLLILYVYVINAFGLGKLPKGTISWTVLTFTVASIFALVLVYPYRKNEDQKLVYWFSRLLPFALSPLVVLLWLAIGMRVGDYGFTPSRVLLTLLAIWLTIINIYLYTGKKWGLMPLAGALTLLCVVAIGWPVNVKTLSIWSQQSIQRGVLQAYNIAEGDSITVAMYNKLKRVDRKKLVSAQDYLANHNSSLIRVGYFQGYKDPDQEVEAKINNFYGEAKSVIDLSFLAQSAGKKVFQIDIRTGFYIEENTNIELEDLKISKISVKNNRLKIATDDQEVFLSLDDAISKVMELEKRTIKDSNDGNEVGFLPLKSRIGAFDFYVVIEDFGFSKEVDNSELKEIRLNAKIYFVK